MAYQPDAQTWTILAQPETIFIDNLCSFSKDTLVVVNIVNKQNVIGKIELAQTFIIKSLRDFSQLKEKFSRQQQEIKKWQESLEYQFQELEKQRNQLEFQKIEFEQIKQASLNLEQQQEKEQKDFDEVSKDIITRKLLGEILQEAHLISDAQLELALMIQSEHPELKIGNILSIRGWLASKTIDFFAEYWTKLVEEKPDYPLGFYFEKSGLLSQKQIDILLAEQQDLKLKIGDIAVLKGWLNKKTLNYFLQNLSRETLHYNK